MNGIPMSHGPSERVRASSRGARRAGRRRAGPRSRRRPRRRARTTSLARGARAGTSPRPPHARAARPTPTRRRARARGRRATAEEAEQPPATAPQPAAPPANATRITGIRPTRSIRRRPARRRSRPRQEDRRAETEHALHAGDRDERDGAERGRELERAGVRDEARGEKERVPANVPGHRPSVRRRPAANARRAAVRGMADVRHVEHLGRDTPDGDRPAGRASARRGTGGTRRSRRGSGGGSTPPSPDASGTTFQSRTSFSTPSSARTRCTIVALASAGPVPVSCRSDVNGMPLTRAPR